MSDRIEIDINNPEDVHVKLYGEEALKGLIYLDYLHDIVEIPNKFYIEIQFGITEGSTLSVNDKFRINDQTFSNIVAFSINLVSEESIYEGVDVAPPVDTEITKGVVACTLILEFDEVGDFDLQSFFQSRMLADSSEDSIGTLN